MVIHMLVMLAVSVIVIVMMTFLVIVVCDVKNIYNQRVLFCLEVLMKYPIINFASNILTRIVMMIMFVMVMVRISVVVVKVL